MKDFSKTILAALQTHFDEALQAKFFLTANGYPQGQLSAKSFVPPFNIVTTQQRLGLLTFDLPALAQAIKILATEPAFNPVETVISGDGWTWDTYALEGLSDPVYCAMRHFELTLYSGATRKQVEPWEDWSGADEIKGRPYGDDPRIRIGGFDWVRHVAKHMATKDLDYSGSATYHDTGLTFELYSASYADFVEKAYGPLFGLPPCAVTRSVKGRGAEKVHLLKVDVPGAKPFHNLMD